MALSENEVKRLITLLKEQAKEQQEINSSLDGYLEGLKKAKKLSDTINENKKLEAKLLDEIAKSSALGTSAGNQEASNARQKLILLKQQTKELEDQHDVLKKNLSEVNKTKLALASMSANALNMVGSFGKLPSLFRTSFGRLKSFGLFEMDKATRQAALDMGLIGRQSKDLTKNIRNTALTTNKWGMGVQELSKLQSTYGDELGRNVMLGEQGLENMSALASATSLGVEGASKISAEMENQGLSAKRTKDIIEKTLNDTTKMGLNASKVIKNIQSNMKLLNTYNFKGGVKGLIKMAETTTKLGVDMKFVSGMADKLFDIDGAVEMSSQLQVMGGEWSKLADPFKLMFMARNDMEGLAESIGKAAASSAHFNKENGQFEISSLEMHRLRKIAEQTGVSYEELATAGKNAAKFSRIKQQISFSIGGGAEGKAIKEFLTNTAQLNKNGKAYIEINGEKKLLSELDNSGRDLIKKQLLEKKTLEQRAESAQSFDEKIKNLVNIFKTTMLPIVDGIGEVLSPLVKKLQSKEFVGELKSIGIKIGEFIKGASPMVKMLGDVVTTLGPKGILATVIGGKALGFLFEKASWLSNGFLLSKGFLAGASGGGIGSSLFSGANPMKGGLYGLAAGGVGMGADYLANKAKESGNDNTSKAISLAGSAGSGALTGAMIGSMIPVIGTAIGAAIGGGIGLAKGLYDNSNYQPTNNRGVNDGIFTKPIHDGKIPGFGNNLGSDFSKNRGIIQGGKITPIDNKDDLLAMKPNGAINKALGSAQGIQTMKIEFGDIHFKFDDLIIKAPGIGETTVSKDLINNPQFTRDLARMIHVETQKAINGGKVKG